MKKVQVNQPLSTKGAAENETDRKVKEIMSKMTLLDKVGEMTQLSIDMVSVGNPYNLTSPHQLDEMKLKEVLVDYRVGSILNAGGHAYTRDHWYKIISRIQEVAMKDKPTGIPVLYGIDAIHGVNYTADGTLFPQQISLAATWDTDFAKRTGEITAYETRASAIPWNFSPVLDIGRDYRWSRFFESFGEDPLLASRMGSAIIEGYQGSSIDHPESVAACMKHFLGYSGAKTGRDRTQAWIPERQLREYYIPTFKAAIASNAATVMINSGEMNGIPVHADPKILKDLLRDELGFKGVAVSDWEDIIYLHSRHKITKDHKESIKVAVNAGIDMSMVPMSLEFPKLLKELVEEGEVPMSRIDEAVERIIRLKLDLGLFENPYFPKERYTKFASAEHTQASLDAAQESITLLKNDNNILPLNKNSKVLVAGPAGNSILAINGAWSRTWQGTEAKWHSKEKKTIYTALQDKLGNGNVDFAEGAAFDKAGNIDEAVNKAKSVDAIIVAVGEKPSTEKPGDIGDLSLSAGQVDLVNALSKTGKPIILVLVQGRPRIISTIEPLVSGIINAYLPGDEGGRALANILLGDVNPSGKQPFTYPRYVNELLTYDHKGTDKMDVNFGTNAFNPQFEFGEGLSYTTFEYSDITAPSQMTFDGNIDISVTVKNTGARAGKEVVQLFISDKVATVTPSVKRLRGFDKIELAAGEMKTVSFTISAKDLAFVGLNNKWVTEPGEFEISIGDKKSTFNLGEER